MKDLNYNNLMNTLYSEYHGFGRSAEYQDFYNKLTDGKTTDEENNIFDELVTAVSPECFAAFKAGFKAAVELMK